ncbi:uncharacterized protein LOC18443735 isoform X2 [Amborella trichopoda]|uniref:uncharacterized protein LOC18443735 isoform X2 n=1 Tax=Amborella trichopoda TaxID=13333 RepID=UPI0005D3E2BE|nr:uncharacterized protein LOC18443735 isoform X2 [Amborella trichopoda]|eukprot:XP_011626873.1 uncharacterized protein LOC18443735 isoform X2 [Amborella trichopoda]
MGSKGGTSPANLRCPHCAGPLTKDLESSTWTMAPFIRDSFSMIGTAVGGTASAFYGFNHAMPIVQKWIKGPMWVHFLVGAPPVILFSSTCAGLAGAWLLGLCRWCGTSFSTACCFLLSYGCLVSIAAFLPGQ